MVQSGQSQVNYLHLELIEAMRHNVREAQQQRRVHTSCPKHPHYFVHVHRLHRRCGHHSCFDFDKKTLREADHAPADPLQDLCRSMLVLFQTRGRGGAQVKHVCVEESDRRIDCSIIGKIYTPSASANMS